MGPIIVGQTCEGPTYWALAPRSSQKMLDGWRLAETSAMAATTVKSYQDNSGIYFIHTVNYSSLWLFLAVCELDKSPLLQTANHHFLHVHGPWLAQTVKQPEATSPLLGGCYHGD